MLCLQGYSRIPVYKQEKENVVYILLAKDLLFLDTEDEKTVEEVCKFYENAPNFVYDDTVLTDMFNEFKTGDKGFEMNEIINFRSVIGRMSPIITTLHIHMIKYKSNLTKFKAKEM